MIMTREKDNKINGKQLIMHKLLLNIPNILT